MRKLIIYLFILLAFAAYSDIYVPDSGVWYETGENFTGSPLIYIHNMEDYDVNIITITIGYTDCFNDASGQTVEEISGTIEFTYNDFVLKPGSNMSMEDFDLSLKGDYYYWHIVSIIYTYRNPENSKIMEAEAEYYDYYEANPHMEGPQEIE
jgi:hypothetical protein